MIKIKNHLDSIVQNCFGDTEKGILEFTQGTVKMTIQSQMLRFFKTACYPSDEIQELYIDICFIIKDNYAILDKIRNLQDLLEQILNPKAYDEVTATVGNINKSGSNMNVSQNESNSQSKNVEASSGRTETDSAALDKSETAVSESNEIQKLNQIMDNKKIEHTTLTKHTPNTDTELPIITTTEGKAPNFLIEETATNKPLFQHYTVNQNSSESTDKTYAEGQTRSDNNSTSTGKTNTIGASKNTIVKGDLKRLSRTGEQALQVLTTEIHTLRAKFWHKFHHLFRYERNY